MPNGSIAIGDEGGFFPAPDAEVLVVLHARSVPRGGLCGLSLRCQSNTDAGLSRDCLCARAHRGLRM
jgi:hypothetical protein